MLFLHVLQKIRYASKMACQHKQYYMDLRNQCMRVFFVKIITNDFKMQGLFFSQIQDKVHT